MVATQDPRARTLTQLDVLEHAPAPKRLRRALVGLDVLAAAVAWLVAVAATYGLLGEHAPLRRAVVIAAVMTPVSIVLIGINRLYLARVCSVRAFEIARLARIAGMTFVAAYIGLGLVDYPAPGAAGAAGAAMAFVLLAFGRAGYGSWLRNHRTNGRYSRPVVIVGADDEARRLLWLLRDHPELGFEPAGFVGDSSAAPAMGLSWVGDTGDVLSAVSRTQASGVIVAASAVDPAELNDVLRSLLLEGVHVHLSTGLKGFDHRRVRSLPLAYEPLFYLEPVSLARWQVTVKRVVDVTIAALVILVTSPVLVASALAIKLSDRGPVLFRHERVGKDGKLFTLYKLRTMVPDAENRLIDLLDLNERRGPLFKMAGDPRVTRIGRLLRATSIDELPQLFNVLRGDMSLVGPRPALPSEVAQFDEELLTRQQVLPGVTGLWQVEARDNPSFDVYRRLDLFYVENWSLALDLAILLGTLRELTARTVRAFTRRQLEVQLEVRLEAQTTEGLTSTNGRG